MQYSGHNTPISHHTDRGSMGLAQYNGLGEYCGPHTPSEVFLILLYTVFRVVQCLVSLLDSMVRFQARSQIGVMDYDEACFMHLTPGVVHNFPKAVGV